jgi:hypothetical protein
LEILGKVSENQSSLAAGMGSSGGPPSTHQYVERYCYPWDSAYRLPQRAVRVAGFSRIFLLSTENTAYRQLGTSLNNWQV